MQNISYIIVITDAIHIVEKIFDPSMHLYQQQLIVIFKELRVFFNKHVDNIIEFWNCSNDEWHLYTVVNKETEKFNLVFLYLSKSLWDFSKKEECNDIIKE